MAEMFCHDGLRRQRTRLHPDSTPSLLPLRVLQMGGPSPLPEQPADALADLCTGVENV